MMLSGDRVRLRAIERSDIPNFVRWLNDREVTDTLLIHSPLSTAAEEGWFDRQLAGNPDENEILGIEILAGKDWVHVGNTGLHDIESVNRTAEFGIFIGEKQYWNQGYGREAARLILKHGFEDLNLNRIYLYVYQTNPRAIKAYEAAGFVREGQLRQAVYKNGSYIDVFLMSILHADWSGRNR
jgi:RimJ/RimL family protein N-acetyltransferase